MSPKPVGIGTGFLELKKSDTPGDNFPMQSPRLFLYRPACSQMQHVFSV